MSGSNENVVAGEACLELMCINPPRTPIGGFKHTLSRYDVFAGTREFNAWFRSDSSIQFPAGCSIWFLAMVRYLQKRRH